MLSHSIVPVCHPHPPKTQYLCLGTKGAIAVVVGEPVKRKGHCRSASKRMYNLLRLLSLMLSRRLSSLKEFWYTPKSLENNNNDTNNNNKRDCLLSYEIIDKLKLKFYN